MGLMSHIWYGGGLHGTGQVIEDLWRSKNIDERKESWNAKKGISALLVFSFCTITWVFFRADTMEAAFYIFRNAFNGITNIVSYVKTGYINLEIDKMVFCKLFILVLLLALFDFFQMKEDLLIRIKKCPIVIRWALYFVFTIIVMVLVPTGSGQEFIYFQF